MSDVYFKASRVLITFKKEVVDSAKLHIQARRTVNNLIRDADLSTEAFSHIDIIYGVWENEDIVETERWRNIGIVFAFVFVSTLLFLGNLPISLMVILCVVLTIIDTVGFNHFWGVKMYFVTITYTTMAVGLCVDYSVHIAYCFIMSEGRVHIIITNCHHV